MSKNTGKDMMEFALEGRYDMAQVDISERMGELLRRGGGEPREPIGHEELDLFLMAESVEHCKIMCGWVRENGLVTAVEEYGLSEVIMRVLDAGARNVPVSDLFPEYEGERHDQIAFMNGVEAYEWGHARESNPYDSEVEEERFDEMEWSRGWERASKEWQPEWEQ